jgi:hypothetical protein
VEELVAFKASYLGRPTTQATAATEEDTEKIDTILEGLQH